MRGRWRGAVALAAYLVLLFYAHVHVALEDHHHDPVPAKTMTTETPPDDGHTPHPATDHQIEVSMARAAGDVFDFALHAPPITSEPIFVLVEVPQLSGPWPNDKPEHPPPRLPEQPRSPPLV